MKQINPSFRRFYALVVNGLLKGYARLQTMLLLVFFAISLAPVQSIAKPAYHLGRYCGGGSGNLYDNYLMTDRGNFWQKRIQEDYTTPAGTRMWEFDHLVISKSCSLAPLKPGDPIQYTITYSNLNIGVNAANVEIRDILPPSALFTYVSSSVPPSSVSGGIITWDSSTIPALASLPAGSYTITVNGICGSLGNPNWPTYDPASYYIMTGGGPATITNDATISNASTTVPIHIITPVNTVVSQVCGINLEPKTVTGYIKSATNSFVIYIFTITNTGSITDNFTLSTIPNVTPPSTANLTFTIQTLAGVPLIQTGWLQPGASMLFAVRVTSPPGTNPDALNLTHIGATSSVCGTYMQSDITTNTYGGQIPGDQCDLQITKIASPPPITVGSNFKYTITINNNRSAAKNVSFIDYLPLSVTYVSSVSNVGTTMVLSYNLLTHELTGIYTQTLKNTDPPIIITVTVKPECEAYPSIINHAAVSSSTPDSYNLNNDFYLTTKVNSSVTAPTVTPPAPICSGSSVTIIASGALAGYDYRWYNTATGGTLLYTGNPFTSPVLAATTTYYIAIFNTTTPSCESSRTPVTVNVFTVPAVTADPENYTVCESGKATFSITATGTAPVSFKWRVNTGSGFNDIANGGVYSGATTNTLTITGATNSMNGNLFQCMVRSGTCGFISSASAMLTVNPLPTTSLIYHQ